MILFYCLLPLRRPPTAQKLTKDEIHGYSHTAYLPPDIVQNLTFRDLRLFSKRLCIHIPGTNRIAKLSRGKRGVIITKVFDSFSGRMDGCVFPNGPRRNHITEEEGTIYIIHSLSFTKFPLSEQYIDKISDLKHQTATQLPVLHLPIYVSILPTIKDQSYPHTHTHTPNSPSHKSPLPQPPPSKTGSLSSVG